jgi:hypothetical protein
MLLDNILSELSSVHKILHVYLISLMCATCSAHLIVHLIILIILDLDYKLRI